MTTTKKDRDYLRWLASFPGFGTSARREVLSRVLDDLEAAEARCAGLEAQIADVRKWAACQAVECPDCGAGLRRSHAGEMTACPNCAGFVPVKSRASE